MDTNPEASEKAALDRHHLPEVLILKNNPVRLHSGTAAFSDCKMSEMWRNMAPKSSKKGPENKNNTTQQIKLALIIRVEYTVDILKKQLNQTENKMTTAEIKTTTAAVKDILTSKIGDTSDLEYSPEDIEKNNIAEESEGILVQVETEMYNQRRYGRPWIATVDFSTRAAGEFKFGEWCGDGLNGSEGMLEIKTEEGAVIATGQKDHRNSKNSAPEFFTVLKGGELEECSKLEAKKHFDKK